MDSYHPIACDLHDYLEIACLYRYRLLLELEDGVRFEAEARRRIPGPFGQAAARRNTLRWPSKERLCCCAWIACWRLPPSRKRPCSAAYA